MSTDRPPLRAMQSTMVYLTQAQKTALARRARQRRTKVAAEIRAAIDAYLAGVTPQELELLDAATRKAKEEIDAMLKTAEEIVGAHARFMAEMKALRKERGE
jgi:hypothetical protein